MPENSPVKIICGPTASGKTAAALELAKHNPVEIISADSRQIYRRLDIGTAKPSAEEQARVPFHLIDIVDPGEKYSAYRFARDADRAIGDILKRKATPLVVGGTGLYLKALSEGVAAVEGGDEEVRKSLYAEMEAEGSEVMFQKLVVIDPEEASRLHPNNHVRVIRALEIYMLTGKTKSELLREGNYLTSRFEYRYHCLAPEREKLYRRINDRVDAMIKAGLLEEFRQLCSEGLGGAIEASNVIGYSELIEWQQGKLELDEAVNQIKQNSRRYAKRQMTWFKHQIEADFYSNVEEMLSVLLP